MRLGSYRFCHFLSTDTQRTEICRTCSSSPSLSRYDTSRDGAIVDITRTDSSTFRNWKGGGDSASSNWYRRLCRWRDGWREPFKFGNFEIRFLGRKASTSCFEEGGPLAGIPARGSRRNRVPIGPAGTYATRPHRPRHEIAEGCRNRPLSVPGGQEPSALRFPE